MSLVRWLQCVALPMCSHAAFNKRCRPMWGDTSGALCLVPALPYVRATWRLREFLLKPQTFIKEDPSSLPRNPHLALNYSPNCMFTSAVALGFLCVLHILTRGAERPTRPACQTCQRCRSSDRVTGILKLDLNHGISAISKHHFITEIVQLTSSSHSTSTIRIKLHIKIICNIFQEHPVNVVPTTALDLITMTPWLQLCTTEDTASEFWCHFSWMKDTFIHPTPDSCQKEMWQPEFVGTGRCVMMLPCKKFPFLDEAHFHQFFQPTTSTAAINTRSTLSSCNNRKALRFLVSIYKCQLQYSLYVPQDDESKSGITDCFHAYKMCVKGQKMCAIIYT